MNARRLLLSLLALCLLLGAAAYAVAWQPSLAVLAENEQQDFPPDVVARGAQLAAVGNCIACHTVPGERAFAGGLALPTPFGTIHSTNITPDRETGIGAWTQEAFRRAMRQGVDREGNYLYPAFPYDHYTRVTDEDNHALYAFLMTRQPVRAEGKPNDLPFPLGFRPLLAGWKLLFLEEGPHPVDEARGEAWNRGRYLVEGLAHCGACHTPRNALGAVDRSRNLGGGEAEGWQAYAINADSQAPVPWDEDSLAFYLRNGWHELHGVSRGPMAEVTGNLGLLPDEDIRAMAAYVASVMGEPSAERRERGERLKERFGTGGRLVQASDSQTDVSGQARGTGHPGEALYRSACANCHEGGRPQPYGGLDFTLSTAVNAPDPQNIITVTLFGLPPADGEASAIMPAFANTLGDAQMADLLAYMRERFSGGPPWQDLARQVRETRDGTRHVAVRPADGIERAPRNVGAKED
ncbi:c-type cytochrome [Shinella sp. BYT-45]|uniref:c-type cytochrome n=1 Tax=Shinella sp. BYT-45 TaxID=3377377 RepID=UPI00397EB2C8